MRSAIVLHLIGMQIQVFLLVRGSTRLGNPETEQSRVGGFSFISSFNETSATLLSGNALNLRLAHCGLMKSHPQLSSLS